VNNKSKKPAIIFTVVAIVVLAIAGYGVFAYSKDMWPFMAQSITSDGKTPTTTDSNAPKPTVKISKLEQNKDVLTVNVKVSDTDDKGHCVLMVMGKRTGLKIDDSETKKNLKDDVPFTDCVGWSVGIKDFPAGKYTVEVQFVGSQSNVSTKKEITLK